MGRKRPGQILTGLEVRFVNAILAGKTQNEAVAEAGYSTKSKKAVIVQASRLAHKASVVEAIEKARAASLRLASVDGAQVLNNLNRIANFDIRHLVDPETGDFYQIKDLPESMAKTVTGVKVTHLRDKEGTIYSTIVEYKFESRLRALEILAGIAKLTEEKDKAGSTVKTIADLVRSAAELGRQSERKENNKGGKIIEVRSH